MEKPTQNTTHLLISKATRGEALGDVIEIQFGNIIVDTLTTHTGKNTLHTHETGWRNAFNSTKKAVILIDIHNEVKRPHGHP